MSKITAKFILSNLPSINSVVGIVALDENNKPVRCLVRSRVLADYGTIGLKRGLAGLPGPIRLDEAVLEHKNILKSIEKMAIEIGADCRVHDFVM